MGNKFHNFVVIITESFRIDNDAIEELRVILQEEQRRKVTHEEAEVVARSLVTVIETLANGRTIVSDIEGGP